MCTAKLWESRKCGHRWTELVTPCDKDQNFGNCKSFEERHARPETRFKEAAPDKCPKCDLKNKYDVGQIRMIKSTKYGVKLGRGPSRKSPGVEFACCMM